MVNLGKSVFDLIGDFYQAHLNGNIEAKNAALVQIEENAAKNKTADKDFADYYNDVFTGRTGFNAKLSLADYPKESIIRELFQNALGCRYLTGDIKILADFHENDIVTISYNEVGFSMEDILYYLGFGMNNGDETREGRFGIGAKSVFLNVRSLSVRSNTFSFKIRNDAGRLAVESICLNTKHFNGTRVTLELDHVEYERIKDNFLTITEKKGDYLNMVELCFAFNRKHLMKSALSLDDSSMKTVNVAVAKNGKVSDVYRIALHCKDENDIPKIRFYHNNKSLLDFLHYEKDGFVYLIPFAVANAKREKVVKLLLAKYNYFSTYELTGYIGNNNDRFIDEKLSAFFVSVPNTCITHSRTGIRHDKESIVTKALERDIQAILKEYGKYFVLDIKSVNDTEYYYMAPRSYAFVFFNSYMKTSRYAAIIKDIFVSGISFCFPGEAVPVNYERLKSTGFKSEVKGVSEQRRKDGTADKEYIELRLEKLRSGLSEFKDKTLYAGYEWTNEDGSETGRVYRYEFIRGKNLYKISSEHSGGFSDFEIYNGFPSVIGYYLPAYLENDCVMDENALEKIFTLFDEAAGEEYSLSMKYYRIHFDRGEENYSFEISKIKVLNIKNAMETLGRRRRRFDSRRNYQEVAAMMVNSFTQGKDTMTFLREIKEQGGEIELILDFNKKYRFQAYGKQFMIPGSITDTDLLEILGDARQVLESGVLKNRKFDFDYGKSVYTFDSGEVSGLLADFSAKEETVRILDGLYMCNLKYDGTILLDENEKVICTKRFGEPIEAEERSLAKSFVILRDDLNKTEFVSIAEYIVTGCDKGILNRFFSRTKDPNRIIPDQISLKYKRAPVLSREEFEFAIDVYNSIKGKSELPYYKSYFAKDINARLYGFGACCVFCGEGRHNINSYNLVDFSLDVMTEEGEKRFNFALYLCGNHIADSDGWFIKELCIGGMNPFMWLKEIKEAKSIPPEFLICSLKYIPHIVYDITPEGFGRNTEIVSAEEKSLDFRITPLMAAKWAEDNKK